MYIRNANRNDADELYKIEKICFPAAEAAGLESICRRLDFFPDRFWLLCDDSGKICAFVNGLLTDEKNLSDDMYSTPEMHTSEGNWQMIFGVDTLPDCRGKGYASALLQHAIAQCRGEGRQGVVLTCKEKFLSFYSKLGFTCEGVSESTHGNAMWYQMRISFSV